MKTEDIKVQFPLLNQSGSQFRVYTQTRDITHECDTLRPEVIKAVQAGNGKAYFNAEYTHGQGWLIGPQVHNLYW